MNRIAVPDAALPYLLYQRTHYLMLTKIFPYRLLHRLLGDLAFRCVVSLESRLRRAQVKRLYQEDLENEYQSIRGFLPNSCAAVLDIGCGMAGIDVVLERHYGAQVDAFYLLDKSETSRKIFYGFHYEAAFYNSLPLARKLLEMNGIAERRIHLLDIGDGLPKLIPGSLDLAISLLSWGFHYPVGTYLEFVHTHLAKGGCLIMDIRKGTDGIALLTEVFAESCIVQDKEKYMRVRAIK